MSQPEQTTASEKYFAVFRNGFRVSHSEYNSTKDAYPEYDYWRKLLNRWPDGSRLNVRELRWRRKDVTTTEETV
jgi:hypothetical protein